MVSDVHCMTSIKNGSLGARNTVRVRVLSPRVLVLAWSHTLIPAHSGPAHFAAYLSATSRLARCQAQRLDSTLTSALPYACARSQ
jgi:hypothetical protein